MIAFCGLDCSKCEAFIATANNDDALRARVAKEWTETFNTPMTPEDINCTGCRSTGVKVRHCESTCEIRKCATGRAIETCADCSEFPCPRLTPLFQFAPHAESTLRSLRKRS